MIMDLATQMVDILTCGNNVLNLFFIFTNQLSLVECCRNLPGISDHEIFKVSSVILHPLNCIYISREKDIPVAQDHFYHILGNDFRL